MTETKFTPGPWFAHGPINANRRDWGVVAGAFYDPSSGARHRIAWVGNASNVAQTPEQAAVVQANSVLIAAAPDLYASLQTAISYWDVNEGRVTTNPHHWTEKARIVLAKARGE